MPDTDTNALALAAQRFAGRVIRQWNDEMGDLDAFDVQTWLVESGLYAPVTATEACGEHCRCAEWDDFPQRCYRLTEAGRAARDLDRTPAENSTTSSTTGNGTDA